MRTILIVDDSPTERHFLARLLTRQGYTVRMLENGADALAHTRTIRPDLILLDVVMPGVDGFCLTRMLRRDPSTQHIPIVLCTSKNQPSDIAWGLRQGAAAYLTKPIDAAHLLAVLDELQPDRGNAEAAGADTRARDPVATPIQERDHDA